MKVIINDSINWKIFFEIYDIILLNIFEEKVFDDTSYTICSFQFELKLITIVNDINIYIKGK